MKLIDMGRTCILILGMHRSGTSALGGIFNRSGLSCGKDLMPANIYNQKGYYENLKIWKFNEKILTSLVSSWHLVLPESLPSEIIKDHSRELEEIIFTESLGDKLFFIKDARISFLFPLYEKALKDIGFDIKIVIPYRHPYEVALSLQKRDGFSIEKGYMLWLDHLLSTEKLSRAYPRIFSKYDDLLKDPLIQLERILDALKIEIDFSDSQKSEIKEFIDNSLKHNVANDIQLNPLISKLYQTKDSFNSPTSKIIFDEIQEEYNRSKQLFAFPELLNTYKYNYFLTSENQQLTSQNQQLVLENQQLTSQNQQLASENQQLASCVNYLCRETLLKKVKSLLINKFNRFFLSKYEKKATVFFNENNFFDPTYYITQYPDVLQTGLDPLVHFVRYGWKENRNPSSDIILSNYLNCSTEIKTIDCLLHYISNEKHKN